MKLSKIEKDFVRETYEFYSDERIATELTRMRYSVGIKDPVTLSQVRGVKRRIKKRKGPGGEIR